MWNVYCFDQMNTLLFISVVFSEGCHKNRGNKKGLSHFPKQQNLVGVVVIIDIVLGQ